MTTVLRTLLLAVVYCVFLNYTYICKTPQVGFSWMKLGAFVTVDIISDDTQIHQYAEPERIAR